MKIISLVKKHATFFIIIGIIILGLTAYAGSLNNKFLWDDNEAIVNNLHIRDWKFLPNFFTESISSGSGFPSNYWRPIILITYAAQWHLWGNWEPGFHSVNILFHIADAILIFFLLYGLFLKRAPAAIAALLFTIHPIQTEAVTFISGLADPLALFFMLAGLLFFLRARKLPSKDIASVYYYLITFILFLLALMTKERSVVFPPILMLVDLFIWKIRETETTPFKIFARQAIFRVLPFILGSAIYLALRATVLNLQNTFNIYGTATYYTAHLSVRLFTFLKVIPTYFSLLFFPVQLHMERSGSITWATTFFDPLVIGGTGIILFLGYLALMTWKRHPEYAFGSLWFLIAIFPSSGILAPVAGILYEHYLYMPIIGFGFIIGSLANSFWEKTNNSGRYILTGAAIIIITLGITQTIKRNADWKDAITFYTNTLRYAPESEQMNNNLGLAYIETGDFPKAEQAYLTAIKFNPGSPEPHHNLGNLYYRTGRLNEAIIQYQAALQIDPNPLSYYALYRLYLDKGEPQKAEQIRQESQAQDRPIN